MKCPHCNTAINAKTDGRLSKSKNPELQDAGYQISCSYCPECYGLIIILARGTYAIVLEPNNRQYGTLTNIEEAQIIYPKFALRKVEPEVPNRYAKDFIEASAVVSISPQASAALSRRVLQNILRDEFQLKYPSLAKEIDEFIKLKDIPSYLAGAVDAVRNIGNFAAHPLKDTNTGEVIAVEPGEAEWLLDVLESLFDFTFVQPKRLEERTKALNEKLKSVGKPPMKS